MGGDLGMSRDSASLWAILPVKPFNLAKSRLAGVLSPAERESLASHLFRGSLDFLAGTRLFAGIVVVSRDPRALAVSVADDYRASNVYPLAEVGAPELNAALTAAAIFARDHGAGALFVLPADVPFIAREDVAGMLSAADSDPSIVIAPDRARTGTNALLIQPPGVIPFAFGVDSFAAHQQLATTANVALHIYESPRVALDIDTPPDWETYRGLLTAAGQGAQYGIWHGSGA